MRCMPAELPDRCACRRQWRRLRHRDDLRRPHGSKRTYLRISQAREHDAEPLVPGRIASLPDRAKNSLHHADRRRPAWAALSLRPSRTNRSQGSRDVESGCAIAHLDGPANDYRLEPPQPVGLKGPDRLTHGRAFEYVRRNARGGDHPESIWTKSPRDHRFGPVLKHELHRFDPRSPWDITRRIGQSFKLQRMRIHQNECIAAPKDGAGRCIQMIAVRRNGNLHHDLLDHAARRAVPERVSVANRQSSASLTRRYSGSTVLHRPE